MDSTAGSSYQSPVRRFSTDLQSEKENSPVRDVNRLKNLLRGKGKLALDDAPAAGLAEKIKDNVMVKLKDGTMIKLCTSCATTNPVAAETQNPKRQRKPKTAAKDEDGVKGKRVVKKGGKNESAESEKNAAPAAIEKKVAAKKDTSGKVTRPKKSIINKENIPANGIPEDNNPDLAASIKSKSTLEENTQINVNGGQESQIADAEKPKRAPKKSQNPKNTKTEQQQKITDGDVKEKNDASQTDKKQPRVLRPRKNNKNKSQENVESGFESMNVTELLNSTKNTLQNNIESAFEAMSVTGLLNSTDKADTTVLNNALNNTSESMHGSTKINPAVNPNVVNNVNKKPNEKHDTVKNGDEMKKPTRSRKGKNTNKTDEKDQNTVDDKNENKAKPKKSRAPARDAQKKKQNQSNNTNEPDETNSTGEHFNNLSSDDPSLHDMGVHSTSVEDNVNMQFDKDETIKYNQHTKSQADISMTAIVKSEPDTSLLKYKLVVTEPEPPKKAQKPKNKSSENKSTEKEKNEQKGKKGKSRRESMNITLRDNLKDAGECSKQTKQKTAKKDKKARKNLKKDKKVAKALEQMSKHFGKIQIGSVGELHIGTLSGKSDTSVSYNDSSSSCSCSECEDDSSSDDSRCNCWNCMVGNVLEESSGSDSSSSDDSDFSEESDSDSAESSSSGEECGRRACRRYNLRK